VGVNSADGLTLAVRVEVDWLAHARSLPNLFRFVLEELESIRNFTLTAANWEALWNIVDGLYNFHKHSVENDGNPVVIAALGEILHCDEPLNDGKHPKGFEWTTIRSTYGSVKVIKDCFSNGACRVPPCRNLPALTAHASPAAPHPRFVQAQ
jgi:hypothetical protein